MKQVFGYWFPDDESHFSGFLHRYAKWGEPTEYQYQVRNKAMTYVDKFEVSVDIGANMGLWSHSLEKKFVKNYSIEPIEEFAQYFALNAPNSHLIQTALGKEPGSLRMTRDPNNYGRNQISEVGSYSVNISRLDDLQLPPADFVKIDVEGFEYEVLLGGEHYIKSSWPVLVVEQENSKSPSKDLLISWGYAIVDSVKHDYIYKHL